MGRGMGLVPSFDNIDDDEAYDMLTTGMEVMRMVRDGDGETIDPRARGIYERIFATGD